MNNASPQQAWLNGDTRAHTHLDNGEFEKALIASEKGNLSARRRMEEAAALERQSKLEDQLKKAPAS